MNECSLGFLVVVTLVGIFLCLVVVGLWVAVSTSVGENQRLRESNSEQYYDNKILQRQLKGAKAEIKWLTGSNQEVR